MLNQTSRKQLEQVLPEFFRRWPTPEAFVGEDIDVVREAIAPLGFKNRRSVLLFTMSQRFMKDDWSHAKELPGIGTYGARAWEIFCCGILGSEPPSDGALTRYHAWAKENW